MNLVELNPRWLSDDDVRVGLTFLCPCCRKNWLTCFTVPMPFKKQVKIMHAAMGTTPEDDHDWPLNWVPSNAAAKWQLSNLADFSTLTIMPSIDASASGNWHGFITNGEVK